MKIYIYVPFCADDSNRCGNTYTQSLDLSKCWYGYTVSVICICNSATQPIRNWHWYCSNFTYLLTHSMVQSPSREANWLAASQEIPRISRNPKVHLYLYFLFIFLLYVLIFGALLCYSGRNSAVGIATRYGQDGPWIESRWRRDFPHPSRPALGPTQPPIQWVTGLSQGQSGRGVALTTHPHLAPSL